LPSIAMEVVSELLRMVLAARQRLNAAYPD